MVTLFTNRPEYQNDIADELRAFLGDVGIRAAAAPAGPEEGGYALCVTLEEAAGEWRAQAEALHLQNGACKRGRAEHTAPVRGENALTRKRYEKRAVKVAAFRALRALLPETSLPWGSLTGIRPTKLLRELIQTEGEEAALNMMRGMFDVRADKLALARDIVRVQQPLLDALAPEDADVYIGIPFCKTRCLYCSFASETLGKGDRLSPYLEALHADIAAGAAIFREAGYRVRSLYIGGGTPTVLSARQLEALLRHAQACYALPAGLECTVEAGRPDTITREKLAVLRDLGVNRISINPQSMLDSTLARIGRAHTAQEVVEAFALAREAGFSCVNMDLIAGLPGETAADFARTLDAIAALRPENLTIHTLAVKRSSRLRQQLDAYPLPAPEEAEEMVAMGAERARALGLRPYYMYRQKYMRGNLENVGYAAAGRECLYNVDMMEEAASIMAHGAGAMTKRVFPGRDLRVERIPNPKDIETYRGKLALLQAQKRRLYFDGKEGRHGAGDPADTRA